MNNAKDRACFIAERSAVKASCRFLDHLPGCFEEIPAVRPEKVRALRNALGLGTWRPKSEKIAERMLLEHLLYFCLP